MAYTGRLHLKGVPFSGFRYILLVEVYERVGKYVNWVCERALRANRWFLWLYEVEKTLYFCDWVLFKRLHLQQLKGLQSSKRGMWKGYHLSIEGIRKGYPFSPKMVCKRVRGWTSGRSTPPGKSRGSRLTALALIWFLWFVKEPTPLFEKSRGRRPPGCGQPSHIIHILGWTESGCRWRLCMLTSELTVHMLMYVVRGHVCCPLIHYSFLPSFIRDGLTHQSFFRRTKPQRLSHSFWYLYHFWPKGLACENIRLSSLFAATRSYNCHGTNWYQESPTICLLFLGKSPGDEVKDVTDDRNVIIIHTFSNRLIGSCSNDE